MNLDVKTEKKSPEKKSPFNIREGQRALLLVPYEETARARVTQLLHEQGLLYETDEERRQKNLPKIVAQIKLSKLNSEDVVFTAVAVPTKLDKRKQPIEFMLKLSKPVEAKKHIVNEDEDGDVSPAGVVDALQSAVHPLTMRIGEDTILKIYSC